MMESGSRISYTKTLKEESLGWVNLRLNILSMMLVWNNLADPHLSVFSDFARFSQTLTLKLLVGITPSGAFSFISKLWSGSTSDQQVSQDSGLIDLLEEGDQVMADRGFTIRDLLIKKE